MVDFTSMYDIVTTFAFYSKAFVMCAYNNNNIPVNVHCWLVCCIKEFYT